MGDRADVTVSVSLELHYPDGTPPNTVRLTQRLLLQVVDGHWRILDAPATDPAPARWDRWVSLLPGWVLSDDRAIAAARGSPGHRDHENAAPETCFPCWDLWFAL